MENKLESLDVIMKETQIRHEKQVKGRETITKKIAKKANINFGENVKKK